MARRQWRAHYSVTQALRFTKHQKYYLGTIPYDEVPVRIQKVWDSEAVDPTEEDCHRFVQWHSQGKDYGPITPGLCRLLQGWKGMGIATGRSSDSWEKGFREGTLFLWDFLYPHRDDVVLPLVIKVWKSKELQDVVIRLKRRVLAAPARTED